MPVTAISGSNPPYSLQSVLTAQIDAVRDSSGATRAATQPPASNSSTQHAPTPPPAPTSLATHGIGASVNHQG